MHQSRGDKTNRIDGVSNDIIPRQRDSSLHVRARPSRLEDGTCTRRVLHAHLLDRNTLPRLRLHWRVPRWAGLERIRELCRSRSVPGRATVGTRSVGPRGRRGVTLVLLDLCGRRERASHFGKGEARAVVPSVAAGGGDGFHFDEASSVSERLALRSGKGGGVLDIAIPACRRGNLELRGEHGGGEFRAGGSKGFFTHLSSISHLQFRFLHEYSREHRCSPSTGIR